MMANRLDVEVSVGETVTTTTQLLTVIDEDVPIFFKSSILRCIEICRYYVAGCASVNGFVRICMHSLYVKMASGQWCSLERKSTTVHMTSL